MLGISVGTNSGTDGIVVKGMIYFAVDPGGNPGDPLYVSTTVNRITATKPSGTGEVVRAVGYKISGNVIYFDPSPNYIVLK
jgi:hypothetical protein